ncbi:hypothetical protein F5Y14DRAFT_353989 [Nemania sp. NC0429]|nr:hypothetical protein F5Y14DRAFT_353989 [Nemania sp. NC0429]
MRRCHVLPQTSSQKENDGDFEVAVEHISPLSTYHGERAQWIVKVRLGGNFSNSQFLEQDGEENVSLERDAANHGDENKTRGLAGIRRSSDKRVIGGGDTAGGRDDTRREDDDRNGRGHRGREQREQAQRVLPLLTQWERSEMSQAFGTEGVDNAEHEARPERRLRRRGWSS